MIRRIHVMLFVILGVACNLQAKFTPVHFELPSDKEMTQKSIDCYIKEHTKITLVLVPGCNEDGRVFLSDSRWIDFAERNNLGLVGVTFKSPERLLKDKKGYYDTSRGSGSALISLLSKAGLSDKSLLMFGISGGAHFVSSFIEEYPSHVLAWCAQAAAWWSPVKRTNLASPPGIVACGSEDMRLGATLSFFKTWRSLGRSLSWVEIPHVGHSRNEPFEDFVRDYFFELISRKGSLHVWVDLDCGELIRGKSVCPEANRSWLPSRRIYELWHNMMISNSPPVVTHQVQTHSSKQSRLTLFLQKDDKKDVKGVLCTCILANRPDDIRWQMLHTSKRNEIGRLLVFARTNNLAVVAWGSSKGLWNPRLNWHDYNKQDLKIWDREFDYVANAWEKAVSHLASSYNLPKKGYLLWGYSGAAQYAQRLALRKSRYFRAVHLHVSSSYDQPVIEGRQILWCVTTGENENGYQRSLAFFAEAGRIGYPIIYKAYPGLGHSGYRPAELLGVECFRLALTHPGDDWTNLLSNAPFWGDVINQTIWRQSEKHLIPVSFRTALPDTNVMLAWKSRL